jgi:hypothetical protein
MAAYGNIVVERRLELTNLPLPVQLRDGEEAFIDRLLEVSIALKEITWKKDYADARQLLNTVIEEGQTYPHLNTLDEDGFKGYFVSHDAFCLKLRGSDELMGMFYIKPNFPGRCRYKSSESL